MIFDAGSMGGTVAYIATNASRQVAKSATDVAPTGRYDSQMLETWLKTALRTSRISQAELARQLTQKLGRSIDRAAVNKMLKGPGPNGRAISADEALAIAEITGYVLPAPGADGQTAPVEDASVSVMIKGLVQAGNWVEHPELPQDDWAEIRITPVAEYPGIALHACRVRGPSMNRIYPDGTILVWVDIIDTMETPVSGKRYIVRRVRNDGAEYETTVKTYIENASGKWLIAESDDPEYQGAIRLSEGANDQVVILGRVVRSIREE